MPHRRRNPIQGAFSAENLVLKDRGPRSAVGLCTFQRGRAGCLGAR